MRKKARKYAHVLSGMIRQPSELRKLSALHPLARAVAEAFLKVKRRAFTNEEISAFRSLEEYRARLLASDEVITYWCSSMATTGMSLPSNTSTS